MTPQDSPVYNVMYQEQRSPARLTHPDANGRCQPSGTEPRADVLPYVVTMYRLADHFTAGALSRRTHCLAEQRQDLLCEVSPELAIERGLVDGDWATIRTARSAIEARVVVTQCVAPLRIHGAVIHQIGIAFRLGPSGQARGDAANELSAICRNPNSQMQELKALSADIRPGRRSRGRALRNLIEGYRQRAVVTAGTGVPV